MPKKLARRFFVLFVLCAALTAVLFPPAASANPGGPFCFDAPLGSGCPSYICCIDPDDGCWCVG